MSADSGKDTLREDNAQRIICAQADPADNPATEHDDGPPDDHKGQESENDTVSEVYSDKDDDTHNLSQHKVPLESKTFAGIPEEWHETIKVKN